MKLTRHLKMQQKLIDKQLNRLIPEQRRFPPAIHEAMHYCIKGGKRIRPILCMASCKICGRKQENALLAACAIEMIHTYSLIHDDLPAMDNDDYRRGRLSCHKKFNEAIAVLTGDAFLTLAYNILSQATEDSCINNRIIKEISLATGTQGMIGGQVVDIQNPKSIPDLPTAEYIASHKTGALIAASCKIGAIIAGARRGCEEAIFRYGEYAGFAFQIADDILDNEGLANILGRKGAYSRAKVLIERAKQQLSIFKKGKEPLLDLADFVLERRK